MHHRTLAYGSYVRNDLGGLGADDATLSLADLTTITVLTAAGVAPQTVTEWAQQTGDVSWTQITALNNYAVLALSDAQLVQISQTAGAVPSNLAVVAPFLSFGSAVTTAFNGTPYAYSRTEAIYSQGDTANPPKIYFLYWLDLRPTTDPQRGNISLNLSAAKVGGLLAYVHEIPFTGTERPAPTVPFTQALAAQSGQAVTASSTDPDLSLPNPLTHSSASASSSSSASSTKTVLIVAGIAAAAFVGYEIFKGK